MVKIYGLTQSQIDKLAEVGFIDEVKPSEGDLYDVTISEEIKLVYHFGELALHDNVDRVELDQLDFVKVEID